MYFLVTRQDTVVDIDGKLAVLVGCYAALGLVISQSGFGLLRCIVSEIRKRSHLPPGEGYHL